jgi:hypothetical protein
VGIAICTCNTSSLGSLLGKHTLQPCPQPSVTFFFFFAVQGFELKVYTLSHFISPFW